MSSAPRVWLVTGASAGLGRAVTEHVLAQGDIVAATLRTPSALADLAARYPSDRLLVLAVDVSVPADIAAAFAAVKAAFGRLDVVYNNAGYAVLGEAEGVRDADARTMFDVNFWGAVDVSREAVRFFRDVNAPGVGGRLLQASSIAVSMPFVGLAHYAATKWALEGLTEGLAGELDPAWNIKITLIRFGAFSTRVQASVVVSAQHPAYTNAALVVAQVRANILSAPVAGDPAKAAAAVWTISRLPDPALRIPVGKDILEKMSGQIAALEDAVGKYASLSDDLTFSEASPSTV